MLRNVNRSAAVFTAKSESLQYADQQQGNRRRHADRSVRGKKSDHGRRAAHDEQRNEKRIFPPDKIADSPEEQSAERPHDEPDGKSREIRKVGESVVTLRIKQ